MTKNKDGRPTDYDPKYCDEILEYFDTETTREVDKTLIMKNGSIVETTEEVPNKMPQFSKFARKIGVCEKTLLNWTEKHDKFLQAYNTCRAIQQEFIVDNGLLGFYQPNFAKFIAINYTNMKDKTEVDSNIKGELTTITREIVDPKNT